MTTAYYVTSASLVRSRGLALSELCYQTWDQSKCEKLFRSKVSKVLKFHEIMRVNQLRSGSAQTSTFHFSDNFLTSSNQIIKFAAVEMTGQAGEDEFQVTDVIILLEN